MKIHKVPHYQKVYLAKDPSFVKASSPSDQPGLGESFEPSQAPISPDPVKPVSVLPLRLRGRMVKVSRHGNNSPVLGHAEIEGKVRRVVFKQEINRKSDKKQILGCHIKAVVASRIMKKFGIPTVSYYPARMEFERGKFADGIISEFVPCQNLYEDPSLIQKITNPDQAVEGSIVCAWLGDSDRIMNEGNVWVKHNGDVIFGDYGYAFRKRTTALGLPKTNIRLMERYATKDNVEPIVKKIASLTDGEIKSMVEEAGKEAHGWNPEVSREITDLLIHNRNELRQKNPFAIFYEGDKRGVRIEIDRKVMLAVREQVRSRAAALNAESAQVPDWISSGHNTGGESVRKAVSSLAKGIPDWNQEIEDQLVYWILFSPPESAEFFKSDPKHFYPLLKFMKSLFTSEEILGYSLGIL